jgi:hypothetical protein
LLNEQTDRLHAFFATLQVFDLGLFENRFFHSDFLQFAIVDMSGLHEGESAA